MPFNGSGVFVRNYSWVTDQANSIQVNATRMDADTNDIANGLSQCVTKDGQSGALTNNLQMGSNKITGLANGTANNDAVNFGQVFTSPAFTGPTINGATLTGVVTAPTQTALNNSTRVATTAYADAAVAAEAALRISNDALKANINSPTFTGTVTIPSGASIAGFAPLASPTFTGNVTVPAPSAATDAANKAYTDALAFATALPNQAGQSGKFVTTNGTTASWASLPPATGATIYLALNAGAL